MKCEATTVDQEEEAQGRGEHFIHSIIEDVCPGVYIKATEMVDPKYTKDAQANVVLIAGPRLG